MATFVRSICGALMSLVVSSKHQQGEVFVRHVERRVTRADGHWGLFDRFRSYAAMPNSSAMKVACAIASSFATHLTLPFRIICTASMPCKVRQAVKSEPYPFASHVRFFTMRWSCSTTLFRYLH